MRTTLGWRDRLVALSILDQDALLYLLAAILALGTILLGESADYRQWAEMAVGPYAVAVVLCWGAARRRSRRVKRDGTASERDRLRNGVILGLLITVMLVPLGVEVVLRADHHPGDEVQNEVTVIEAGGDRVMNHKNCYLAHPKTIGGSVTSQSEDSFFPYLPGMCPFGLINATSGPAELKDARIPLTGFSLIVIGAALLLAEVPSRRRWRLFQVVVVLPSGALPMVTGGDDLPVIALMMLGLALATRRRPVWSGLAIGLAGTLKFTAWPLLILLALGEWDRRGRRAILRYSFAVAAVAIPILGIGIGSNWHAFVTNAIKFPLGLTRVKSPAASPLLGQELVVLFPSVKPEIIALLGLVGLAAVAYGLKRWTPSSPQSAAGFSGLAMLLATVLAPATRFGYLIYPLDLLSCAVLFTPLALGAKGALAHDGHAQDASGISNSLSVSPIAAEVCPSPASEGEIDGLTGATITPTSHS
jgi:glycosyl transferase family 87